MIVVLFGTFLDDTVFDCFSDFLNNTSIDSTFLDIDSYSNVGNDDDADEDNNGSGSMYNVHSKCTG